MLGLCSSGHKENYNLNKEDILQRLKSEDIAAKIEEEIKQNQEEIEYFKKLNDSLNTLVNQLRKP